MMFERRPLAYYQDCYSVHAAVTYCTAYPEQRAHNNPRECRLCMVVIRCAFRPCTHSLTLRTRPALPPTCPHAWTSPTAPHTPLDTASEGADGGAWVQQGSLRDFATVSGRGDVGNGARHGGRGALCGARGKRRPFRQVTVKPNPCCSAMQLDPRDQAGSAARDGGQPHAAQRGAAAARRGAGGVVMEHGAGGAGTDTAGGRWGSNKDMGRAEVTWLDVAR